MKWKVCAYGYRILGISNLKHLCFAPRLSVRDFIFRDKFKSAFKTDLESWFDQFYPNFRQFLEPTSVAECRRRIGERISIQQPKSSRNKSGRRLMFFDFLKFLFTLLPWCLLVLKIGKILRTFCFSFLKAFMPYCNSFFCCLEIIFLHFLGYLALGNIYIL